MNRKRLIIIITTTIIAIASIIIFSIISLIPKGEQISIEVKYAPFIAEVRIDGHRVTNNATNDIAVGTHKLTAKLNHFSDLETEITISQDTTVIYGSLIPSDDQGLLLTKQYNNDFLEVESLAGVESNEFGNKEREEYKFLDVLPYDATVYSIGYSQDNEKNYIITISGTNNYLGSAIEKLLSLVPLDELLTLDFKINDFANDLSEPISSDESDPTKFLQEAFSNIENEFTVNKGEIIDSYYCTTISVSPLGSGNPMIFRIILERSENVWKFATTPNLLYTYKTTPNLPQKIIKAVDKL